VKLIDVKDLAVNYGDFRALDSINFHINSGDFLAVAGPNGSGKSTLIKTIIGLIKPSEGIIQKTGKDGKELSVGYLPQKSTYADPRFPATVEEIVSSGLLREKSFPRRFSADDKVKVENALTLLRVEELKKRQIGRLSGGQQQRALLARALVSNPAVLVLDEPTGALDPTSRDCFYTTLKEMNNDLGITIVIVSHDTHEIGSFANQLLFLDRQVKYFGDFSGFENSEMAHYFSHNHSGGAKC
jgi:zinc transport system ATP-binding protein